jgi:hypothetical protein
MAVPRLMAASPTPEAIRSAFMACIPSFSEEHPSVSAQEQACLIDVMYGFYREGHNDELWAALRIQEFEAPFFYFPCHDVLHRVGERAYFQHGDMAELILANNTDVCGTAFIMGGLDAFGAMEPSPEEFRAAAAACESMSGPGFAARLRGMCEHSMGHVAWKSTLTIDGAAARCALMASDAGKMSCADGVMMQIYEPANSIAVRPIEEGYEHAGAVCDMWPNVDASKAGCYGGAGYVFSRPLYKVDLQVRLESDEDGKLSPDQRERLREVALFVVEKCKALDHEPGVAPCLRRAAWAIPGTVFWDQTLIDEVCAAYEGYEDNCLVSEEPF